MWSDRMPARSYLFAPGNSEKLLRRVFEAGADAVVLDLEDAVPPQEKDAARLLVVETVRARRSDDRPAVYVRVNALEGGRTREDIAAVVGPGLAGVRLPKAEKPEHVRAAAQWLAEAEALQGVDLGAVALDLTIETARGVAAARELAECTPRVRALVFGQADYLADVGGQEGPGRLETLYARSEVVLAARLAGLGPPIDGAYTRLRDPEGLRAAASLARQLGFFGMSAIHPEQIPAIHEAFTPSQEEVLAARRLLARFEQAQRVGQGALRLDDGTFVDAPVAERARMVIRAAERRREK